MSVAMFKRKLDIEDRACAEELVPEIMEDPDAAAYEVIWQRREIERLTSVADAEMKLREGNFAEIERLQHDMTRQMAIATEHVNEAERLRAALRGLMTNPHISLGDQIYSVRDREGLGWDGPSVKAWSDAVRDAEALIKGSTAVSETTEPAQAEAGESSPSTSKAGDSDG